MSDTPFKVIGIANWPEYFKTLPREQKDWAVVIHDVIREMRNDYPVVTETWVNQLSVRVREVTAIIMEQENINHQGLFIIAKYDSNANGFGGKMIYYSSDRGGAGIWYDFETDTLKIGL
jgi:hypothetical protein